MDILRDLLLLRWCITGACYTDKLSFLRHLLRDLLCKLERACLFYGHMRQVPVRRHIVKCIRNIALGIKHLYTEQYVKNRLRQAVTDRERETVTEI